MKIPFDYVHSERDESNAFYNIGRANLQTDFPDSIDMALIPIND